MVLKGLKHILDLTREWSSLQMHERRRSTDIAYFKSVLMHTYIQIQYFQYAHLLFKYWCWMFLAVLKTHRWHPIVFWTRSGCSVFLHIPNVYSQLYVLHYIVVSRHNSGSNYVYVSMSNWLIDWCLFESFIDIYNMHFRVALYKYICDHKCICQWQSYPTRRHKCLQFPHYVPHIISLIHFQKKKKKH